MTSSIAASPAVATPVNEYEVMIGPPGAQWSVGEMIESKRFAFPKLVRQAMRDCISAQMLQMGIPRLETSKQGDFLGAALSASGYNLYSGSEAVKKIWRGKANNFLINYLKGAKAEALAKLRGEDVVMTGTGTPSASTPAPASPAPAAALAAAATAQIQGATPMRRALAPAAVSSSASSSSTPALSAITLPPILPPPQPALTPEKGMSLSGSPVENLKKGQESPSDPWRQLEDQVLLEQLDAAVVAILQRGSKDAVTRARRIIQERFKGVPE